MSRYTSKVTPAKIWTKHIFQILKGARRPMSTYALLSEFYKRAHNGTPILKPGTSSVLSPPDINYLNWMAEHNLICKTKLQFQVICNRVKHRRQIRLANLLADQPL